MVGFLVLIRGNEPHLCDVGQILWDMNGFRISVVIISFSCINLEEEEQRMRKMNGGKIWEKNRIRTGTWVYKQGRG